MRTLTDADVCLVGGRRVATPLRTAVDLGRLPRRDQALAAMNAVARVGGLAGERTGSEAVRFRGQRGVRQLRCHDARLTGGVPQVRVEGPGASSYYLDLAFEESGSPSSTTRPGGPGSTRCSGGRSWCCDATTSAGPTSAPGS